MKKNPPGSGWVKIAIVYGSVFLGAGFASGRELLTYFVGFGRAGLIGIIFAGLIFAAVGWAVLSICRREKLASYHELMQFCFGKRLGTVMEWAVAAFLFCLFAAMLAGAGALGHQAFGLPFSAGALVIAAVVLAVIIFGLDGIVKINIILAPFMLIGGIFVGLMTFFVYTAPAFALFGARFSLVWLLSATVYASYNLVTAVPVLTAAAPLATTKKSAMLGGVVGGGIITVLGLAMALPLFLYYADIIALEIPFLYIMDATPGISMMVVYLAVLISALLTTAACNAFAVMQFLRPKKKFLTALILCLAAFAAAHVGFSSIVAYVYPVFGFLGLMKIITILMTALGARVQARKCGIE